MLSRRRGGGPVDQAKSDGAPTGAGAEQGELGRAAGHGHERPLRTGTATQDDRRHRVADLVPRGRKLRGSAERCHQIPVGPGTLTLRRRDRRRGIDVTWPLA